MLVVRDENQFRHRGGRQIEEDWTRRHEHAYLHKHTQLGNLQVIYMFSHAKILDCER